MAGRLLKRNSLKVLKSIIIIGGIFFLIVGSYIPNHIKLKRLKYENKTFLTENEKVLNEIKEYEETLKNVGTDNFIYEKIARDELGLAKNDEIVIDIER